MEHFLSIVVPVYNVEDCISRCLDSILKQTFTNFECIVVDDGSKDKSGEICDEYAKKDSRIHVIHQENKGLSGARNTAMSILKGDLVGFVDSDDWLCPTMYERLTLLLDENDADIVMCSYQSQKLGEEPEDIQGILRYTGHDFTEKILRDEYGSQLWKFIYKTPLWEGIVSPERRHVQDMMILHKVTDRSKCVVVTGEKLYCYNNARENNISNGKKNKVKNKIDRALAFFWRMDFCNEKGYSEEVKKNVINQAVGFAVNSFYDNTIFEEKYSADVKTLREYFGKYKSEIKLYCDRWDYKLRAKFIKMNPKVYVAFYNPFLRLTHRQ